MKLKQEGLRPGALDLFVPIPRGNHMGFFIEMKYGKNKLTEEQKDFIKGVEEQGYLTAVCYSAEEAIDWLERYLDGKIIRTL